MSTNESESRAIRSEGVRDSRVLNLSLVSHTNVGKTTLARTLVRGEVGEVLDQAHVTDENDAYTLIETDDGERLELWDTPGFGDSARLLRRLKREDTKLGWLMSQVWDRFSNRPLWCSQQAIKNVKDEADVVLYLVNAAEDPEDAGYVGLEMQVLSWVERPVILLLNQTGPNRAPEERARDVERWREYTGQWPIVADVLELDAFSRCWVQEGVLLEKVGDLLPADRRMLLRRLLAEWSKESARIFDRSMSLLADHLARVAADRESMERSGKDFLQSARRNAMKNLAMRLELSIQKTADRLVEAHALEGETQVDLRTQMDDFVLPPDQMKTWKAGAIGSAISGAVTGLTAEIMTGGLSLGSGVLVGGVLGFFGATGLSRGVSFLKRSDKTTHATWSEDFLFNMTREAILRYLSVAHFGRGFGRFIDREKPEFWHKAVEAAVERRKAAFSECWKTAQVAQGETGERELAVKKRLEKELAATCRDLLAGLHPAVTRFLG